MIVNNLPKFKTSFNSLFKKDVLVGVPRDTTERKDDSEMNNATLAYIHDQGSPANNIPARPFMKPGVKNCETKVVKQFKTIAQNVLKGESSAIDLGLNRAGLVAQASIRGVINDGIAPPLADSTLKARIRSGMGVKGATAELASRDAGNDAGMGLAKPLVLTGQLRNSINYVIREK